MDNNCQKMPDKTEASTGRPTWLWPATYTRKSIHEEYVRDMNRKHLDAYGYDAFIKILANDPDFSNCKRADRNSNFKCDVCLKIAQDMEHYKRMNVNGVYDDILEDLKAKNTAHMRTANSQRAAFKKHQEMAREEPDKYLSLIIDGMDQSKLNLPSLSAKPHLRQKYGRYKTSCTQQPHRFAPSSSQTG